MPGVQGTCGEGTTYATAGCPTGPRDQPLAADSLVGLPLNYAHGPERPGLSWPYIRTTSAFGGPSHPFDFRQFRVFLVGSELDWLNAHPLLQLGHESSKFLLAGFQELAHFRAGPHGFLIRAPSFGKKRKVFNERTSVLGELVHRFCVPHGWWRQWLVLIFGKNLLGNNCGIPFLELVVH